MQAEKRKKRVFVQVDFVPALQLLYLVALVLQSLVLPEALLFEIEYAQRLHQTHDLYELL